MPGTTSSGTRYVPSPKEVRTLGCVGLGVSDTGAVAVAATDGVGVATGASDTGAGGVANAAAVTGAATDAVGVIGTSLGASQIDVGQEASGACVRLGHNLVVRPPVGERPQCGRDCRNDERCLSAIRDRAEDEAAADEHHEPE